MTCPNFRSVSTSKSFALQNTPALQANFLFYLLFRSFIRSFIYSFIYLNILLSIYLFLFIVYHILCSKFCIASFQTRDKGHAFGQKN